MNKPATSTSAFEECWLAYNRKGVKKVAKAQWDRLSEEEREQASRHIPFYVSSRERVYCKDFERYLRDRVFQNPIFNRQGEVVYDPDAPQPEAKVNAAPAGFQ